MKTEDEGMDDAVKHSRGPWAIIGTPDMKGNLWIHSGQSVIASVQDNYNNNPKMVAANARLIAAAPSLLTALQGLLATCELNTDEMEDETRTAIRAAQDAVRNARGEV